MRIAATLACAGMFLFSGCVQTIAVNTVGNIVDQGFSAFTEDTDLAFVEEALPANIKLLEVLLKNNPTPSEADIREALSGNLCRCTGYQNIVKAVQQAAEAMRQPSATAAS